MRTIVWFRGKDLRVADHRPLREAATAGDVIPLFVVDPFFFAKARPRELPHRMQYLVDALEELARSLQGLGSRLVVVAGKSVDVVPRVADVLRADRVVAHRWVEPFGRERDARIRKQLGDRFSLYEGETLLTPGSLRNGSGEPYAVYTPFAKAAMRELPKDEPLPAPRSLPPLPASLGLEEVALPTLESLGIARNPSLVEAGERAARKRMRSFLDGPVTTYAADRDRMDHEGTSRLSADLKFGTISVRTVMTAARALEVREKRAEARASIEKFEHELLWREFTHHMLWDRPRLLEEPFRREFAGFPYTNGARELEAWWYGKTGYPIVDASARQLLAEGWVHNRARMISASFLTKHLLVDYKLGEAHYMKYLVDGDWAQNNAGWQWSAGSGCDAQPYFRVFNPVTQGKKFDPDGAYVRRWVPELRALSTALVHEPWKAAQGVLGQPAGPSYPSPIVDLDLGRKRFLEAAAKHLKG